MLFSLFVSIERAIGRSKVTTALVNLAGAIHYAGGTLGVGLIAERLGARPMLAAEFFDFAIGPLVHGWTENLVVVDAATVSQSGSGEFVGGVRAVFPEQILGSKREAGGFVIVHIAHLRTGRYEVLLGSPRRFGSEPCQVNVTLRLASELPDVMTMLVLPVNFIPNLTVTSTGASGKSRPSFTTLAIR